MELKPIAQTPPPMFIVGKIKMSDPKITSIEGSNKPNPTADAIRQMKANLPELLMHMTTLAVLQKAKFDALRKEGFNDAQALELSKNIF